MKKFLHKIITPVRLWFSNALTKILFKAHPVVVIFALGVVTVAGAYFLPNLSFNYDIESFFSESDPEVAFYYQHRQLFGNENDFVLVGVSSNQGFFRQDFLQKIERLTADIKKVKGVTKVLSPTSLYRPIMGPLGLVKVPLVHPRQPAQLQKDQQRIYSKWIYTNAFFASDTTAVSLLVELQGDLSKKENEALIVKIDRIVFRIYDIHYFRVFECSKNWCVGEQCAVGGFAG